jgi:SHAQKYF class myb-like DNA-binding protein
MEPTKCENLGRWSTREHSIFIEGLRKFGRNWKLISTYIGSRSADQVRSHAQKFELKCKIFARSATTRKATFKDSATQYGEDIFFPPFNLSD